MVTRTLNRTTYYSRRWFMSDTKIAKSGLGSKQFVLTDTRTGDTCPNWKTLISNHQNATTHLTGTKYKFSHYGHGGGDIYYYWDFSDGRGPIPQEEHVSADSAAQNFVIPTASAWQPIADARARNAFLSKVRQAQTKFSSGTFLGELKEALHMIHRPFETLSKSAVGYIEALRKRKRLDPKHWQKAIPGTWLEYSFGWVPLMNDIQSARNAYNSLFQQEKVQRVSGSGKDFHRSQESTNYAAYNLTYAPYSWFTDIVSFSETRTVRYYGDVVTQATTTYKDGAAQWGFTPSDFVPTMWELLPWSFLIDYFASIGDCLDAQGANTADIKWVGRVERHVAEREVVRSFDAAGVKARMPVFAKPFAVSKSPGIINMKKTTVTRDKSGVPVPALYIKWSGPNWGQIANMSALLGQASVNLHFQNPSKRTYRR